SGTAANLVDVIFAAGKFVAVAATGEILTSPDGAIWTSRPSHASALNNVVFAGGRVVALGAGSGYWTSTDGESWTAGQHGSALPLNDAVEFKGRVIAVGSNGSILAQDVAPVEHDAVPTIVVHPVSQIVSAG